MRYVLRNFSEGGLGVLVRGAVPPVFTKGRSFRADLLVGSERHGVEVEVMRIGKGIVGLRITEKSKDLSLIFRKLLEPTSYAAELLENLQSTEVDRAVGFPRLWYSTAGTELLIWYERDTLSVLGLQLRWIGQWVFRERRQPPQTGYLAEFSGSNHGSRAKRNEIKTFHAIPDAQLLQRAGQFLVSVPRPLPGNLLWQFLENGMQIRLPEALCQTKKRAA